MENSIEEPKEKLVINKPFMKFKTLRNIIVGILLFVLGGVAGFLSVYQFSFS